MQMDSSLKKGNGSINILNVGTKLLRKDLMDQYIRTLGDYKTYYADSVTWALRTISEKEIHIVITETDLHDGSAFRLCQAVEGENRHIYFVFVKDEDRSIEDVRGLAAEVDVQAVLTAPFTQTHLKTQIEYYKKWREEQKEPWRLLLRNARTAIHAKNYADAEKNFQAAIQVAPNNPVPLYKAGTYYMGKQGHVDVAMQLLEKAVQITPDSIPATSALGLLFFAEGELNAAELLLRDAQKWSPLNPDRLVKIAQLHVALSMKSCQESLRLDFENAEARMILGKLLLFKKDYIHSIQELERSLPALKDDLRNEAKGYIALARKLGGIRSD